MPLTAKTVRSQLVLLKPIINGCSLKAIRRGQNKLGEIMESRHRDGVIIKKEKAFGIDVAWAIPKDRRREGVILYLHGGGYTCGDIEYALGFASMLSARCGTLVFCPAYRLAPENRFPAALLDAVSAYKYLLENGFSGDHITVCGESAGGGLCYSLCLKLRELSLPMPAGIIALSPWTDLTASGESYERNRDADPTMSDSLLSFFADSYTDDRKDPLVSPLFAELSGMPPSLILAGGDEIMLSDSELMHKKLQKAGAVSKLSVKEGRWHGYLLYGLSEDRGDFTLIDRFLSTYMLKAKKLRWMRLDNAAKIYPAARRSSWSNVFRLSATLKDDIDCDVLATALDVTVRRFPSMAVRLRRGVFWYYLEQLSAPPEILEDYSYPLTRMSNKETSRCAVRVLVYNRRIALEIFHSLTDGTGALIFLKTLVAEYIQQKYSLHISNINGVLSRLEEPSKGELEDSFQKYAGAVSSSRKERTAYHITGTPEENGYLNVTSFSLDSAEVLSKAHERGVTLTAYLAAVMMMALVRHQRESTSKRDKKRPIKVLLPVNLRRIMPSCSLRNFALYTTPEILPELGEYTLDEVCKIVANHMALDITPKQMSMKIAANIKSERNLIVRIMPLFIKNIVMRAVFDAVGERKSCLSLSNLGDVKLPEEMRPYVDRFDFILGVQASAPYNCGVISYNGRLIVNFIRNIKQSALERHFYEVLRDDGVSIEVQTNGRGNNLTSESNHS